MKDMSFHNDNNVIAFQLRKKKFIICSKPFQTLSLDNKRHLMEITQQIYRSNLFELLLPIIDM